MKPHKVEIYLKGGRNVVSFIIDAKDNVAAMTNVVEKRLSLAWMYVEANGKHEACVIRVSEIESVKITPLEQEYAN